MVAKIRSNSKQQLKGLIEMAKTLKDIIGPKAGRTLTNREKEFLSMHQTYDAPTFFKKEGGEPISKKDPVSDKAADGERNLGEAKDYNPDSSDNKEKKDRANRFASKKAAKEKQEKKDEANEETITELSSSTLRDYLKSARSDKKSSDSMAHHAAEVATSNPKLKDHNGYFRKEIAKHTLKAAAKNSAKRAAGMNKAVDKLASRNEQEENIDELSNDTLKSYKRKAGQSFQIAHADKHLNDNKTNGSDSNERTMTNRAKGMYHAAIRKHPHLRIEDEQIIEDLSDHISDAIHASGSHGTDYERVNNAVRKVRENARSHVRADHPALKHIGDATKHLGKIKPDAKGSDHFSDVRNSLQRAHHELNKPKLRVKAGSQRNEDEEMSLVDRIAEKILNEKSKCNKTSKGKECPLHGMMDCTNLSTMLKTNIVDEKLYVSKGRSVAAILSRKHSSLANEKVYASDKEGTKAFHRHVRAAERYNRIALGKRPFAEDEDNEDDFLVTEKLSKDSTVSDYIDNFIHSDNTRFKGKTAEKRRQMALAAYYAAQKKHENIDESETTSTPELIEEWNNLSHAAKEIVLHNDDSHELNSSHNDTHYHLQRKLYDKTYNHKAAVNLWHYHADRAARSYSKMRGSDNWHKDFPHDARKEAANYFANRSKDKFHHPVAIKQTPVVAKENEELEETWHVIKDKKVIHSSDGQAQALKVYRANPGSKIHATGQFKGERAHIALGPLLRAKHMGKNDPDSTSGPWGKKTK